MNIQSSKLYRWPLRSLRLRLFSAVNSPVHGLKLSVPMSAWKDLDMAVNAAKKAFVSWSKTPIKERFRCFLDINIFLKKILKNRKSCASRKWQTLFRSNLPEIEKSIELSEFLCSLPPLVTGEVLEVSKAVECRTEHVPPLE